MFAQVPCRQWTEEVVSVLEKVREQGALLSYRLLSYRVRNAFASRKCTTKRDFDIDRRVSIANAHMKHIIELIN